VVNAVMQQIEGLRHSAGIRVSRETPSAVVREKNVPYFSTWLYQTPLTSRHRSSLPSQHLTINLPDAVTLAGAYEGG